MIEHRHESERGVQWSPPCVGVNDAARICHADLASPSLDGLTRDLQCSITSRRCLGNANARCLVAALAPRSRGQDLKTLRGTLVKWATTDPT